MESDASLELDPGLWAITMKDTGIVVDHEEEVLVDEADITVTLYLTAYDGLVESNANGELFLDGESMSPEMMGGYRVPPGSYIATTGDPNHQGKSIKVTVVSGESSHIEF